MEFLTKNRVKIITYLALFLRTAAEVGMGKQAVKNDWFEPGYMEGEGDGAVTWQVKFRGNVVDEESYMDLCTNH